MTQLKISKIRDVRTPEYGTPGSAGIDFFIPNDLEQNLYLAPQSDILIPSGIKVALPKNKMLIFENKSGIATSCGAMMRAGKKPKPTQPLASLIIGACIVDSDYQGEVHLHIINAGKCEVSLSPGMKIAQAVIVDAPQYSLCVVPEADLFESTSERGEGSFGSTNK
jgi:dUTP pyrophosphatase